MCSSDSTAWEDSEPTRFGLPRPTWDLARALIVNPSEFRVGGNLSDPEAAALHKRVRDSAYLLGDIAPESVDLSTYLPVHPEKYKERYQRMQLPCRHCLECLIAQAAEWGVRGAHEVQSAILSDSCWFITLTYANAHLPLLLWNGAPVPSEGDASAWQGDIVPEHAEEFLYRARIHVRNNYTVRVPLSDGSSEVRPVPIRYLADSEYGPHGTRRPHHHFVVCNLPLDARGRYDVHYNKNGHMFFKHTLVDKLWGNKGNALISAASASTAFYTSGYVIGTKKSRTPPYAPSPGRDGPSSTLPLRYASTGCGRSRWNLGGLGRAWLDEHLLETYPDGFVVMPSNKGVRKVRTPAYYDAQLVARLDDPELSEVEREDMLDRFLQLKINRLENVLKIGPSTPASREARAANAEHKVPHRSAIDAPERPGEAPSTLAVEVTDDLVKHVGRAADVTHMLSNPAVGDLQEANRILLGVNPRFPGIV